MSDQSHLNANDPGESSENVPVDDIKTILNRLGVAAVSDQKLRGAMKQIATWLEEVTGTELRRHVDYAIDTAASNQRSQPHTEDDGLSGDPRGNKADDDRDWFAELRTIVPRRARLKAECCRWVPDRRRRLESGEEYQSQIAPLDRDLIDRARAMPYCYLWMLDSNHGIPDDVDPLQLAGCYETLADAAELLLNLMDIDGGDDPHLLQRVLFLLAESVSAARFLVLKANNRPDPDVDVAFQCLRQLTRDRHIYIPRHMRVDDPADPTIWPERRERIDAMHKELDAFFDERQEATRHVGTIREAASTLGDFPDNDTAIAQLADASRCLLELRAGRIGRVLADDLLTIRQRIDSSVDLPREFIALTETIKAGMAEIAQHTRQPAIPEESNRDAESESARSQVEM